MSVHGPHAGKVPLTEATSSRRGAVRRDGDGNNNPGDGTVDQPLPGKLHGGIEEPWRSWRRGELLYHAYLPLHHERSSRLPVRNIKNEDLVKCSGTPY